jgi:pimeloyl-ACP methyl ester carboxylesterase
MHRIELLPDLNQALELCWIEPQLPTRRGAPVLVFLHEGLGSITQWRDFPQALCNATGLRGMNYARQGYGLSSARATVARTDYMHIEAHVVLPALLKKLKIDRPILVGHSDGGSIALLYAAWSAQSAQARAQTSVGKAVIPAAPLALCVMAPHLFVEDFGLKSIAIARKLFDADPSFRERLGKHHRDVVHTFNNWADVWLSDAFKTWNIEDKLIDISCPILAIQGTDDQYGSLAQIRRIAKLIREGVAVDLLEIPQCKHSPHLEHGAAVLEACKRFLSERVH